ncbi:MAG: hypothetical protein AABY22_04910 [Nanoarchaeota archaeon]
MKGGENMNKQLYRQGDVDIKPIKSLPKGLKKAKDKVLALGEVTGHFHRFADNSMVDVFLASNGLKYLQVHQPSPLIHEEHNEIMILPGTYKVEIEREYSYEDEEMKKVVD